MPMNNRLMRPRNAFSSPRSISGLALWFDADDATTITLNGLTVSEWRDKSGNNRHATQSTATRQPTYTTNSLNGKPTLNALATGTAQGLVTPAWAYSSQTTLVCVFRTTGTPHAISQRGAVNSGPRLAANDASGSTVLRSQVGAGAMNSSVAYTLNSWAIGGAIVNTSLTRVYLNGLYGADGTGTNEPAAGTSVAMRLFSLSDTIWALVGGIAEFIYYDRQLSASEVTQCARYLSKKWNISLS